VTKIGKYETSPECGGPLDRIAKQILHGMGEMALLSRILADPVFEGLTSLSTSLLNRGRCMVFGGAM
jgi:hypothetical protein